MLQRFVSIRIALLSILLTSPVFADDMTFCAENKKQPPLVMGDSDYFSDESPGISVEMVQMSANFIGLNATFIRTPWKRCLVNLKAGKINGVFNGSFKSERLEMGQYPMIDDKVAPSKRIATISYSLYRKIDSPLNWDGKNITNANGWIGAPAGYSIVTDLKKRGVRLDESDNTTLVFKKLSAGRIAGLAAQTITGDAILASNLYPRIERIDPPLVTKPYYVLLSHKFVEKDPELAKQFWERIAHIRETETPRLAQKYIINMVN